MVLSLPPFLLPIIFKFYLYSLFLYSTPLSQDWNCEAEALNPTNANGKSTAPDTNGLEASSNLAVIGLQSKAEMYHSLDNSSGWVVPGFLPCEPWNSCVGRCNSKDDEISVNYPPYTCHCDALCTLFSDCCEDYAHCCRRGEKFNVSSASLKFSCVDLGYDRYGILMVDKCVQSWFDDEIRRQCEDFLHPVTDSNGIVYKNGYCAICNGINYDTQHRWQEKKSTCKSNGKNSECGDHLYFQAPVEIKLQPRRCVHHIGNCSDKFVSFPNADSKCKSYSGMVMVQNRSRGKAIKFKNPYCGLCNGVDPDDLRCPQWEWKYSVEDVPKTPSPLEIQLLGLDAIITQVQVDFRIREENAVQSQMLVPPSVAVLLNFGLGGKKSMYYSNKRESFFVSSACSKGQVWDPFLEVCHNLSCTSDFTLINYRCEKRSDENTRSSGQYVVNSVVTGLDPNKVIVSMKFKAKSLRGDKAAAAETLASELPALMSSTFGISKNRISNVTLTNRHRESSKYFERPYTVTDDSGNKTNCYTYIIDVRFVLSEPSSEESEPSIARLMSLLVNNVNLNTMFMSMENLPLRLVEVHEESIVDNDAQFENWCRDGRRRAYSDDEFTLMNNNIIDDDWEMQIYINSTGLIYRKGEYLANFVMIYNDNQKHLPFAHGVIIVCEKSTLPEQCLRLQLQETEFVINENLTVTYFGSLPIQRILLFGQYEIGGDGVLYVCYDVIPMSSKYLMVAVDPIQAYLAFCLNSLSLFAMIITFTTYAFFKELRTLPGVNLMHLIFSLCAFQITFSVGMRGSIESDACRIIAIVLHYIILVSFFWTSVMAFDLYKTFGNNSILPFIRNKRKSLKYYLTFAYLSPTLIVIAAFAIDACRCTGKFWVGYGRFLCWISNPLANIIFFALPIGIILSMNFVYYVITIYRIIRVVKKTRMATKHRAKNDAQLYIRMSTVMGFTWIVGFAAQLTSPCSCIATTILTYFFIIFNSLQGLFICWAFVCTKRVFDLYKKSIKSGIDSLKRRKLFVCKQMSLFSSRESSRSTSLDSGQSNIS